MKYVVGFLFDHSKTKVLLIEKNKPSWQKGLLNGVGGKVESDDKNIQDAMQREFKEETGLNITDWKFYCQLSGYTHFNKVYFYVAFGDLEKANQIESERLIITDINQLPDNILYDLKWLIPLAAAPSNITANVTDELMPGEDKQHG